MYVPAPPTVETIVSLLQSRRLTLASAESFTCGLFAAHIGNVPGVSQTFLGGAVTYSAEMKTALCGVASSLIDRYGVVSAPVAVSMADGIRRRTRSNVAVSFTGVAGPGPSDGLEPGTAFIAACTKDHYVLGNLYSLLANRPQTIEGELNDGPVDATQIENAWEAFVRDHVYSIDACRLALAPRMDSRAHIRQYGVDAGMIALDTLVKKTQ